MARPLRIEFDRAFYHVTSRGNAREPVFIIDTNRVLFIDKKPASIARLKTPNFLRGLTPPFFSTYLLVPYQRYLYRERFHFFDMRIQAPDPCPSSAVEEP